MSKWALPLALPSKGRYVAYLFSATLRPLMGRTRVVRQEQ